MKVFAQNGVPDGDIWKEYWMQVDELFDIIDHATKYAKAHEPNEGEIVKIFNEMNPKKASYGPMTIDLMKLGGEKMFKVVHRCIVMCIRNNVLPDQLREEKMTLLFKNKGFIDVLNDYRGIFLRNVVLSVYQKWLYSKNADCVDENGSEYACGGRKKRSGSEALLIVKLVQDYFRWTKQHLIIRFLDVEKFFDTMNFKLALVESYKSGVKGGFWQCYKTINKNKLCIPHVPSGKCSPINVHNVFVQGSCDAVLMAWPLMDADAKRNAGDCFESNLYIEGIKLNRLSFVDDQIEFELVKCDAGTLERSVTSEVFEKKTRLNYKISKCKVIGMNKKKERKVVLNGQVMEEVSEHVYLGTIISKNGQRLAEMKSRTKQSKSVANEIVQICKVPEMSRIRLQYVKILMNTCLDGQVKYGCGVWDVTKYVTLRDDLDRIRPHLIKRVLELPASTPSVAIQYEFGINNLSLDVLMEKVIMAAETLKLDENRIAKQLLLLLMEKQVDGYCTELTEACCILKIELSDVVNAVDSRKYMKRIVTKLQGQDLLRKMILCSKMDKVLLAGFKFDGNAKQYLYELDFDDAKVIFISRYRMWPTKKNFPGRWSGNLCNVCGCEDVDEHIFSCPGYLDIVKNEQIHYDMLWDDNVLSDMELLKQIAQVIKSLIERMEVIQRMGELDLSDLNHRP